MQNKIFGLLSVRLQTMSLISKSQICKTQVYYNYCKAFLMILKLSAESIFGLSVFISVIQSIISAICCAINLVLLYRVNCSFDNCPMDFLKSDSHSSCFSFQ